MRESYFRKTLSDIVDSSAAPKNTTSRKVKIEKTDSSVSVPVCVKSTYSEGILGMLITNESSFPPECNYLTLPFCYSGKWKCAQIESERKNGFTEECIERQFGMYINHSR